MDTTKKGTTQPPLQLVRRQVNVPLEKLTDGEIKNIVADLRRQAHEHLQHAFELEHYAKLRREGLEIRPKGGA